MWSRAEMIKAERKAGRLAPGHRPKKGDRAVTLKDAGIAKMQASRWGKLGAMTESK